MAPNIIPIWLVSNILTKLFIGTDQPRTSPSPVRAQIRRYIPMKSMILRVCVRCRSAITVDEPDCLLVMGAYYKEEPLVLIAGNIIQPY